MTGGEARTPVSGGAHMPASGGARTPRGGAHACEWGGAHVEGGHARLRVEGRACLGGACT
jgi:hypothetical protein